MALLLRCEGWDIVTIGSLQARTPGAGWAGPVRPGGHAMVAGSVMWRSIRLGQAARIPAGPYRSVVVTAGSSLAVFAARMPPGAVAGQSIMKYWPIAIPVVLLVLAGLAPHARAAHRARADAAALAGLRICDVMTPAPAIGAGWMSISDFVGHVALRSSQTVFPVIGADGGVIGVVALSLLSRVPLPARTTTALKHVVAAVPSAYLAQPDDPAAPLLTRPPLAGEVLAVVTDGARLTGLVTSGELRQAIWRQRLHIQPVHVPRAHSAAGNSGTAQGPKSPPPGRSGPGTPVRGRHG